MKLLLVLLLLAATALARPTEANIEGAHRFSSAFVSNLAEPQSLSTEAEMEALDAEADPDMGKEPVEESPELLETEAEAGVATAAQVAQELKAAVAANRRHLRRRAAHDEDAPRFVEKRKFLGFVRKVFRSARKTVDKVTGRNDKNNAESFEDCLACRMVWKQVEMDVSNARYVEDVQASFEHNCMDAQKSNIFYKACEDMYDDMYAMTDDYMAGKYTVDEMCQRAKLCQKAK